MSKERAIPEKNLENWRESVQFIAEALNDVVHPDIRAHIVGLQSEIRIALDVAREVES
jgi:hypothetical protein